MYIRRSALIDLKDWNAFNVIEDADLGIWRWFGLHALFFPAIANFLFAPFFWVFWCMAAGLVTRQDLALSHGYSNAIAVLFALALLTDGAIGVMAAEKSGLKGLKRWLPLQHIYFAMATFSAHKAFYGLIVNRFHWTKTTHGD